MFNYFNRESNEMKYTAPYKERLEKRTKEICQGINCTEEDMLNLETLARMSVPEDKFKIESVKRISQFSEDYEEFIRARFFRGLSPEEFEKDEKIMLEFNLVKAKVKEDFRNRIEKYFSFMVPITGESLEEYSKRVLDIIKSKKSKNYDNIERYSGHGANALSRPSGNPIMINEELVDIYALRNTIIDENVLAYTGNCLAEAERFTNTTSDAILVAYGYYLMKYDDIYDSFEKTKKMIYLEFGNAYEDFNKSQRKVNDDGNETVDYNIESMYEDYEDLPMREKMVKPIYNPGMYATFYAAPDNIWEYLSCKRLSSQFADSILNNGINNFVDSLSCTLEYYAGTEEEKSIRHAVSGISKELRRKNNKISNKKIEDINKRLKSI